MLTPSCIKSPDTFQKMAMNGVVFLLQDFIAHTDRSQFRLALLADVHPIHSLAGMNAGYRSLGSGNTGAVGDIVTKGGLSASCCRLLPSLLLPLKTDFCLPQWKDTTTNLLQLTEREYSTCKQLNVYHYMHFLYKAVCIWGEKEACVLLLCLTLV